MTRAGETDNLEDVPQGYDVAVIGGGAAGIVAALSSARRGAAVVVLDRMPRLGKKILITGGGRCNLSNENLDPGLYTTRAPDLVSRVFAFFGGVAILRFFKEIGLETVSEAGRVYPVSNQAASVLKVLEMELARRRVGIILNFEADRITASADSFTVRAADGRGIGARAVILCGGGRSYPALGSNGSGYRLAEAFGHTLVTPVPSAVPLLVKDRLCHELQGQKIRARASASIDGSVRRTSEGDVLFTPYGLSGTAILDVSESLSVALHRESAREASVALDLAPFLETPALAAEIERRLCGGWAAEEVLSGILPEKFRIIAAEILSPTSRSGAGPAASLLASSLKGRRFPVHGTRGWNEAEFTAGGIDAREIDPDTLESRLRRRLYFAGEILDVQGGRGGYNLAWAWASGHVAGAAAASPAARNPR